MQSFCYYFPDFTGEAVVAEAQNVLMYAPLSEKQGKSGILTVTNFKLSFVTTEERHREVCFGIFAIMSAYNNIDSF